MIYRKFNNLKFTRTYIGGSKERENQLFLEVQGTKEDNSECNWIEYRRMLKEYSDDKLNILTSWVVVVKYIMLGLAGFGAGVAGVNIFAALLIFGVAGVFKLLHIHLKSVEQKRLTEYDFSLDIINRETGLTLAKN